MEEKRSKKTSTSSVASIHMDSFNEAKTSFLLLYFLLYLAHASFPEFFFFCTTANAQIGHFILPRPLAMCHCFDCKRVGHFYGDSNIRSLSDGVWRFIMAWVGDCRSRRKKNFSNHIMWQLAWWHTLLLCNPFGSRTRLFSISGNLAPSNGNVWFEIWQAIDFTWGLNPSSSLWDFQTRTKQHSIGKMINLPWQWETGFTRELFLYQSSNIFFFETPFIQLRQNPAWHDRSIRDIMHAMTKSVFESSNINSGFTTVKYWICISRKYTIHGWQPSKHTVVYDRV